MIGNGESRLQFDLATVPKGVVTFGCNALYRDLTKGPDYLGAVDTNITTEIINDEWLARGGRFICSDSRVNQWVSRVTDRSNLYQFTQQLGWSTGPMMIYTAAITGCDPIYLMGFDMGWLPPGTETLNNVYKDTECYRSSDSKPTYTKNWETQFSKTKSAFPEVSFCQLGPNSIPDIQASSWEDFVSKAQSVPVPFDSGSKPDEGSLAGLPFGHKRPEA